eukprot:snap_masked-scaffold_63-processed-gene-0.59-mRNA-1 protein AED:1.00 eAED:1.00 QI:0/0/0/0/1/1/2/0/1572
MEETTTQETVALTLYLLAPIITEFISGDKIDADELKSKAREILSADEFHEILKPDNANRQNLETTEEHEFNEEKVQMVLKGLTSVLQYSEKHQSCFFEELFHRDIFVSVQREDVQVNVEIKVDIQKDFLRLFFGFILSGYGPDGKSYCKDTLGDAAFLYLQMLKQQNAFKFRMFSIVYLSKIRKIFDKFSNSYFEPSKSRKNAKLQATNTLRAGEILSELLSKPRVFNLLFAENDKVEETERTEVQENIFTLLNLHGIYFFEENNDNIGKKLLDFALDNAHHNFLSSLGCLSMLKITENIEACLKSKSGTYLIDVRKVSGVNDCILEVLQNLVELKVNKKIVKEKLKVWESQKAFGVDYDSSEEEDRVQGDNEEMEESEGEESTKKGKCEKTSNLPSLQLDPQLFKLYSVQGWCLSAMEKTDQRSMLLKITAKFLDYCLVQESTSANFFLELMEFLERLSFAKKIWFRAFGAELSAEILMLVNVNLDPSHVKQLVDFCDLRVVDESPSVRVAAIKNLERLAVFFTAGDGQLNQERKEDFCRLFCRKILKKIILCFDDERPVVRRNAIKCCQSLLLDKYFRKHYHTFFAIDGKKWHQILHFICQRRSDESVAIRNAVNETVSRLLVEERHLNILHKKSLGVLLQHFNDPEESVATRSRKALKNIFLDGILQFQSEFYQKNSDHIDQTDLIRSFSVWKMLSSVGKDHFVSLVYVITDHTDHMSIFKALQNFLDEGNFNSFFNSMLHILDDDEDQTIKYAKMIFKISWKLFGVVCSFDLRPTTPINVKECVETWRSNFDLDFLANSWEKVFVRSVLYDCLADVSPNLKADITCTLLDLFLNLSPRLDDLQRQTLIRQFYDSICNNLRILDDSSSFVGYTVLQKLVDTLFRLKEDIVATGSKGKHSWASELLDEIYKNVDEEENPAATQETNQALDKNLVIQKLCRNVFAFGAISLLGFDLNNPIASANDRTIHIREDLITLVMGFLTAPTTPTLDLKGGEKRQNISFIPPSLRANAFVSTGKLCLTDHKLATDCVKMFIYELNNCQNEIIRNNMVPILYDLCRLNTTLVSNAQNDFLTALNDPSFMVRGTALWAFRRLIQEDFLKINDKVLIRFAVNLVDPGVDYYKFLENPENRFEAMTPSVKEKRKRVSFSNKPSSRSTPHSGKMELIKKKLWKKNNSVQKEALQAVYGVFAKKDVDVIAKEFLDILFTLNGQTLKNKFIKSADNEETSFWASEKDRKNLIVWARESFIEREICADTSDARSRRLDIYDTLFYACDTKGRFQILRNLFEDVVLEFYVDEPPNEFTEDLTRNKVMAPVKVYQPFTPRLEQLFIDLFKLLENELFVDLFKQAKGTQSGTPDDEEEDQVAQTKTQLKAKVSAAYWTKHASILMMRHTIPITLKLFLGLKKRRSGLQKYVINFLVFLYKECYEVLKEAIIAYPEFNKNHMLEEIKRYVEEEKDREKVVQQKKNRRERDKLSASIRRDPQSASRFSKQRLERLESATKSSLRKTPELASVMRSVRGSSATRSTRLSSSLNAQKPVEVSVIKSSPEENSMKVEEKENTRRNLSLAFSNC